MANKEQLLEQMRDASVIVDHGYNTNRQGYTAQAVAFDIPGGSIHLMTAAHNLNGEYGTIFDPATNKQSTEPFEKHDPDTGVSQHPYPDILAQRTPLKAGEALSPGDTVLVLSVRHEGGGKFTEHTIEGTMTDPMKDPYDHQMYPSFFITSGHPALGDSGAMVVPLTRNGVPQTSAELIGVYRGGEPRGRISPIPEKILQRIRQATTLYD